jgi:TolB-like protein
MAQRVEQLADIGGLCITAAVRESLSRRLPVEFENLGQQKLKGFEETIGVYKVTASEDLDIPLPEAKKDTARSSVQWRLIGSLAVVALIVAGVFYWVYTGELSEKISSADSLQDKPTIAVLPFTNMSGDPEQEYFADGMTEDLITDISKVSGLFVIARNSVFTYKGKAVKVQQIAEELGVRYVLEGSVRRAADQVRINAQLIDATTGGHIWAERYDGSMADVFSMQDQVAAKIVNALSIKLTPQEIKNLETTETSNTAAHDAYLQGISFYLRNTPADNAKAEKYLIRAVELDPEFKRAYAALAKVYFKTIDDDYGDAMGTYWRIGIYLAQKNLAKIGNADIADAYVVRARIALYKHQVGAALQEAERALKLSSNDVDALKAKAAALIYAGQYSEGRKIANLVLRLDPAVPEDPLNLIGLSHFAEGNYKAAVDFIERALKHNPTTSYFAGPLAAAYGKLGMENKSNQAFNTFLKAWGDSSPLIAWVVYLYPFQDEAVLEHLADGFAVAGAREGLLERYLKLTPETRLSGQEIKSLFFGHTIRGRDYWSGRPWTQVRTPGGKFVHSKGGITREGESWIEDDRVCDRWLDDGDEITVCSLIFHDPVKCWTNDKGLRRCGTVVPTEFAQSVEHSYRMLTDQGPDSIRVTY